MIPIQLTFKGLYSYAKSVTIDFEPLVAAKLFGIFGPVGSGKSAILEAIMFVLFDRTIRLNKTGDDRYYNMMNLQSNEMSIDFIFKSGHNNKTKYRFYFLARRSAKDFDKVDVKDRSYYQWSKSDWKPLKSPEVLGMTYENFMQTVIIPQGRFRQFIDQKPTARTEMLNELFHLDRFDISQKAFQLLGKVKKDYHYLEGQLSQFEEINSNLLKQLKKEIDLFKVQLAQMSEDEKSLTNRNEQLQLLKHLHTELEQVSESVSVREAEQEFYRQKRQQLDKFLKVRGLFKEKILRQQEWLLKAKTKQQELQSVVKQVEKWSKQTEECKKNWQNAEIAYSKKDHIQAQVKDLSLLKQLKVAGDELIGSQIQYRQLSLKIEKAEQNLASLDHGIDKARSAVQQKSELQSKLQELTVVHDSVVSQQEKLRQLEILTKEINNLTDELNIFQKQHKELLKQQLNQQELKTKITQSRNKLQELLVEDDWRKHAGHLEDGKPCPLCGATSHPNPLTHSSLIKTIGAERKKLDLLETSYQKQLDITHQLEVISVKTRERQQQLKKVKETHTTISKDQEKLKTRFSKLKVSKTDPKILTREISRIKMEMSSLDQQTGNLESEIARRKQVHHEFENHRKTLQTVVAVKEKLQGRIDQIAQNIQVLDQKAFLSKTKAQLDQLERQLTEKIEKIDRNYKQAFGELSDSEQQLNQQMGLLKSLEVQVSEIKSSSNLLDAELLKACKKEGFKGLTEVQNVLALNLNTEQEQKELENYQIELNGLRTRQQFLVKKMGKKRYLELEHLRLIEELDQLKLAIKQRDHQLSSKLATYNQYLIQLKKKDHLKKELEELTLRKNNVQEICNLLRGNGFMNFISSVYLQNLVESANTRFIKLTANSLSLELNEQNEFMVRDHLNDGKLRLLKTLSGGQIFQASLSLALSLAENVKKLSDADQSFFFLDEGFGSLDRPSLQLVFETLKSLQKENRIVGVISHVEELQLEIDTFLKVEKYPEKGSVIRNSWQIESTND